MKKLNNDVEIFTDDKTASPSSPSSLTRPLEVADASPTSSPAIKKGNIKRTQSGNSYADEKEAESKFAKHIADGLVDLLCYDEIGGDWYSLTNGLWQKISEKRALKLIMEVLNAEMPQGYPIAKLNNIKSFLTIYLLLDKWESNRHLLPMVNGVLDTKTMQLSDYNHKHRFNWQLPYPFDPDAKFDVTEQWLWVASGQDMESINIIRAFFKMALVGGDVQKFLELIGSGGTGKSTLIRLLVAFIGEKNHTATDLKNLETNRFEAAALYGKRLILISDSSRHGGEVSVLKALTGGDPVRFEKKNQQQSGSFVFDGVVVIASNEAIQTADYTSGLIRRRMPVNFNRKVSDADKIKWSEVGGIESVMHKELSGLFNWVMAMTDVEVRSVIGGINGQMTQTQRNHLVETNKIAAWMDENIIINPDSVTYVGCSVKRKTDGEISLARREKLYANYESWCADNAVHPVALQRFTANITDVCDQLKIDAKGMKPDKHGKPIKGIAIRREQHSGYATPVTKRLVGEAEVGSGEEVVRQQSPVSDDGEADYHKNLSVIKAVIISEDPEYF